jgi:hypothetical protein
MHAKAKLVVLLAALCSPLAVQAEATKDIAGHYLAQGVGVNGGKYESEVTIAKAGESYSIVWKFADRSFTGIGILRGDVLSVGWSNDGKAGVVLYTVKGDTLEGKWADGTGDGRIFDETLTRHE